MRDFAALRQAVEGTEFDSHVIDEIIETHFNDQYDRLRMLYAYKQDTEAITHEVTKRIGSYLFKYADELRIEFRTLDGLSQSRQIPHVDFLQNRSCA